MEVFRIDSPLPQRGQTLLLEASAGTGKTFSLASLFIRYIVDENIRVQNILLITFTRLAGRELRDRAYGMLVQSIQVLEGLREPDNDLDRYLVDADQTIRDERLVRLQRALIDFDSATIGTIHHFCSIALKLLRTTIPPMNVDHLLDEGDSDLLTYVTSDIYLDLANKGYLECSFDTAKDILAARIADPSAILAPTTSDGRKYFLHQCMDQLEQRKKSQKLIDYNDLLTMVSDRLISPVCWEAQLLQTLWPVVLVDEFQDTDPIQWKIINTAFRTRSSLILIGDPKQAIYRFRGGDLDNYLSISTQCDYKQELTTNWRSDQCLVTSLNTIFSETDFGNPLITATAVDVPQLHYESRLVGPDNSPLPPVRLRAGIVKVAQKIEGKEESDSCSVGAIQQAIAYDLARECVKLLQSGAMWSKRPIKPSDLAILVDTHYQAQLCKDALDAAGIRCSYISRQNVFHSNAADEWRQLLDAIVFPWRRDIMKTAALGAFFNYTINDLHQHEKEIIAHIADRIHSWTKLVQSHGVMAILQEAIHADIFTHPAIRDKEQLLTDLIHLGQLMTHQAQINHWDISQLRNWLTHRSNDPISIQNTTDELVRISSDDDSVKLMTIYVAKGLEFPIVYLPYLWHLAIPNPQFCETINYDPDTLDSFRTLNTLDRDNCNSAMDTTVAINDQSLSSVDMQPSIIHHSPQMSEDHSPSGIPRPPTATTRRRLLYVDGFKPSSSAWQEANNAFFLGKVLEHRRITYVGLTRAQSQVILWGDIDQDAYSEHNYYGGLNSILSYEHLQRCVETGAICYENTDQDWTLEPTISPLTSPLRHYPSMKKFLTRSIDHAWSRMSYSGLTRHSHHQSSPLPSMILPDEEDFPSETTDEPAVDDTVDDNEMPVVDGEQEIPYPLQDSNTIIDPHARLVDMPKGTQFGSLIHAVLETTDPQSPNLVQEIHTNLDTHLRTWPVHLDSTQLTHALYHIYHTPLGPLAGNTTLAEISLQNRISEMRFEIPLSHAAHGLVCVGDIAPLIGTYLSDDDPFTSYCNRLTCPPLADQPLAGYLSGSIDIIFRLNGPRYFLADYKTNYLGQTPQDYSQDRLVEAMISSDYLLQAILYSVVLHRFLRWRQPDYHPDTHFGGVLYLFLRGMHLSALDQSCGILSWRPPIRLITALSDMLHHGTIHGH